MAVDLLHGLYGMHGIFANLHNPGAVAGTECISASLWP